MQAVLCMSSAGLSWVDDLLLQRPAVVNLLHMTTCRKEKPLPACMSVEAS